MNKLKISNDGQNIGFFIENKQLILIVPKFYKNLPLTSKEINNEFLKFYSIFSKYQNDFSKQKNIKDSDKYNKITSLELNNNDYTFSIIELYFSLINDYQKNNLILFKQIKICNKPQGKINWTKTIKTNNELLSDDSLFYKDFYYNNLSFNYNHPITILHACSIMNISNTFNIKVNLPYNYIYLKSFENSKNYIVSILKKYKKDMFSDREKYIFNLLEQLYLEKDKIKYIAQEDKNIKYVNNFDVIWEKMLKVALFDEYDEIKKCLPKGFFNLKDSNNQFQFNGLTPIPDILLEIEYENNDYLLVIDAKNYVPDYNELKGMPTTSDIIKQIFYKYFLSKEFDSNNKFEINRIINSFVLPDILNNEKIVYIGKHEIEETIYNKDIAKILCFKVDFNFLKENYLKPQKKYRDIITKFIVNRFLDNKNN